MSFIFYQTEKSASQRITVKTTKGHIPLVHHLLCNRILLYFNSLISSVPKLNNGDVIRLKSWKGDYLHRPNTAQGVTTWHTGIGNEWTVVTSGGAIQLKSWKGDFLHRPDTTQGVTTWHTGIGNSWTVTRHEGKISLKSWKGDYLHRPNSPQGVTTWHTGIGNLWSVEIVTRGKSLQNEKIISIIYHDIFLESLIQFLL